MWIWTNSRTRPQKRSPERLREALVLEAAAAEMLLRGGRDSVPALREALNHANPIVRRFAATVLGGNRAGCRRGDSGPQ